MHHNRSSVPDDVKCRLIEVRLFQSTTLKEKLQQFHPMVHIIIIYKDTRSSAAQDLSTIYKSGKFHRLLCEWDKAIYVPIVMYGLRVFIVVYKNYIVYQIDLSNKS